MGLEKAIEPRSKAEAFHREGRKGTRSKPVLDFPLRTFASFVIIAFCAWFYSVYSVYLLWNADYRLNASRGQWHD